MERRFVLLLASVAILGCGPKPTPATPATASETSAPVTESQANLTSRAAPARRAATGYEPPAATKNSGCKAAHGLPDPACTPGAVMTSDLDVICNQPTGPRRKVSSSVHKAAFTDYGFSYPQASGAFEVDHLIPLELGGDNIIANLWAEAASPKPGFHEKDHVENYLHQQVCNGSMFLADAQREVATNWLSVWKKISSGTGDDGEEPTE